MPMAEGETVSGHLDDTLQLLQRNVITVSGHLFDGQLWIDPAQLLDVLPTIAQVEHHIWRLLLNGRDHIRFISVGVGKDKHFHFLVTSYFAVHRLEKHEHQKGVLL